jgi:hypothetical protein
MCLRLEANHGGKFSALQHGIIFKAGNERHFEFGMGRGFRRTDLQGIFAAGER